MPIAGSTREEFNRRKGRKGDFWEDRCHATAVENDEHLVKCLDYNDLNAIRAGVVQHPSEWEFSGHNEIQIPRERYALVDYNALRDLLNFNSMDDLSRAHRGWQRRICQSDEGETRIPGEGPAGGRRE